MRKSNPGSVIGSDLIEEHQLCGSKKCPSCGHKFQGKPDWVGLPAGVKFDPTDQELIEHLEAKVLAKEMKSHPLIDEFILTIEGEDGICYTHPEKLPGVSRDGLNRHFFHRPSKAYTTGTRKRRKIQNECDIQGSGETRWHKTGKTRPVLVNGKQKGCKKILVLYTNFGKNRKPEKTNWVMHQYHLGTYEEEKEGELVVSKIFYQTQPRQCNWSSERNLNISGEGNSTNHPGAPARKDHVVAVELPSYAMEQLGHFPLIRKSFHEVGRETPDVSDQHHHRSSPSSSHHMTHDHNHYHHHPNYPISTIISPSSSLHHHSINIIEDNPYHVPAILLPNQSFQTQRENIGRRSASGLEELIMGCNSSPSHHLRNESSQEAEWLKYSSFWSAPDSENRDHHG